MMIMKNILKIGFMLLLGVPIIFSCEKQNDVKANEVQTILQRTPAYFANLRAYKASDHQIFFGWFGGTGTAGSPNELGVYDQIPDSVDIVSLWGGYPPEGSHHANLLQEIRREKGTRFVWVLFGSGVDDMMDRHFSEVKARSVFEAIDSVAKAIADTITRHGLDGFDLDYEPSEASERNRVFGRNDGLGSDAGGPLSVQRLFQALSNYLGPQSGSGKLLIIDGYNERGVEPFIDYLVQQAYYASTPAVLQGRYNNFGFNGVLPPHKFVPAEDFERGWRTGGVNFTDPNLGRIPSLLGFAYWNPTQGQKGGVGVYHAEYEYGSNPDYNYIRQAIQILNPAGASR